MRTLYDGYQRLLDLQTKINRELEILKKRQDREAAGKTNRDRQDLDLNKVKKDFSNIFTDIYLAVEESRQMKSGATYRLTGAQVSLPRLFIRADAAETYTDISDIIEVIVELFEDFFNFKTHEYLSSYDYPYEYARVFCEFGHGAEMTAQDMLNIKDAISWKYEHMNVLEISVKCGDLATFIKQEEPEADVYGIDTYKDVTSNNRHNYKRLISGALKGATISKGVFDVVYCLPKIDMDLIQVKGVNIRLEKESLLRSTDYVRENGVMIFGIPYYRMYKDICEYLCRNYDQIQIVKSDDDTYGMVYIIGKKRTNPIALFEIDRQTYLSLRRLPFTYKCMKNDKLTKYDIPAQRLTIEKFRGSELSEQEVEEFFQNSSVTKSFWKSQTIEKLSESSARPLLPFNVGQLGLILTSGCLDGIIDEGDGCCHAVKGRVVKKNYVTETGRTSGEVQLTTTYANRVEINVFLPDGTYKSLA